MGLSAPHFELSVVMPGLDPGIHSVAGRDWHCDGMDCRIKSGNDDRENELGSIRLKSWCRSRRRRRHAGS